MKIFLISFLSFTVHVSLGQIKVSYIFRDNCTDSLYSASYSLFRPSDSKSFESDGKDLILDSPGTYMFSTSIQRNDEVLLFYFSKTYKSGNAYIDTINIPRFLLKQNRLHVDSMVYYFCGSRASGLVKDYYPNGSIRMEGSFLNGIPLSDIKFFNINGVLVLKSLYRSGRYLDTRSYHDKDKSEYY